MMFGQITGVPILDYHRLVAAGGSAIPEIGSRSTNPSSAANCNCFAIWE